MNLHVAPDNVFTNAFIKNLEDCGVLANNRIVVRTNLKTLRHVSTRVPFASLYTTDFDLYVGNTAEYDNVYIHQFTPLLYHWVARNDFRTLNWAVWGADLYNLPFNQSKLYEPLTLKRFVNRHFSLNQFLYSAKLALLQNPFRKAAYGKVKNVLTWMQTEFEFARNSLPALNARHQFFFYENQLPYAELDQVAMREDTSETVDIPTYILGNSSTPELNHLDAVMWMHENGVQANLKIPVSYGHHGYAGFLKKNLAFYTGGTIEFIERYMNIREYTQMLSSSDGLIMNSIRPQGYGNIFMMMYLGKPVFLNSRNHSAADLDKHGLRWQTLDKLKGFQGRKTLENRSAILKLLSHEHVLTLYRSLFS